MPLAKSRAELSARRARVVRFMTPLLLYFSLSCAATWPLANNALDHFPLGNERAATVPFASAWALWWTSARASQLFEGYWDAPIFAPSRDTFALSEAMPLIGLVTAPLLWLGLPLAFAYDAFVLAALTLNGLSTYLLLRRLSLVRSASLVGGAFVCLMPSIYQQLGVLTLVPLFGIVFTLAALLALVRAPSLRAGLALGLAFAATFLMCAQYALLLAVALAPSACLAFGRRLVRFDSLRALAIAGCVAAALTAPVVLAQRRVAAREHLHRSEARVLAGSARLSSYLLAPVPLRLLKPPGVHTIERKSAAFFVGTLKLALAALGLGAGVRRRSQRRACVFLLALALLSFALSISPRLTLPWPPLLGTGSLLDALATFVPGIAQVRSLWRAGLLVQLAVLLLAAHGLHRLAVGARAHLRKRHRTSVRLALATLGVLACVETFPLPQALAAAPVARAYEQWSAFMRGTLAPHEPYCLFPFVRTAAVASYEDVARMMVLTSLHGRPMVNGYSSYFPGPYEALRGRELHVGDRETASMLARYGVRYVVLRSHAAAEQPGDWSLRFAAPELDLRVYALPGVGVAR